MKVLIVDDSRVARRSLLGILQKTCDLEEAVQLEDGEAAAEAGANAYIIKPYLPSTVAERMQLTLSRAANAASRKQTQTALVADDSAVIRKILHSILSDHLDFNDITQAVDDTEAVALAQDGDFDLIFLDWNMPGILGIDVLREIRGAGNRTPVDYGHE